MATTFPYLEEVKKAHTAQYKVLKDRSDWGLVFHRLRRLGPGITNPVICVNTGTAPYAAFIDRTDLPVGTRMFAPDVGVQGSYWRWDGTTWLVDAPFYLILSQGSVAAPVTSVNNPGIGYTRFGPQFTCPLGLFSVGRRLEVQGAVYRVSGTSATPNFTLQFGGIALASIAVPLTGGVPCELKPTIWVPTTTSLEVYTGTTATDVAVATLQTAAQTLNVGITETVANAGNYKLNHIAVKVVA